MENQIGNDFMSDQAVLLGGILLGDTFRLGDWLTKVSAGAQLIAFSDPYNAEVVDVFLHDTELPIIQNIVMKESERKHFHWDDFVDFKEFFHLKGLDQHFDAVYFPALDDLHHPLMPIAYSPPKFDLSYLNLPDEFIVCQPQTHYGFKNINEIYRVRFPLPVVNIGSKKDLSPIQGAINFNGMSLRQVCQLVSMAKLFVGIDSWGAQFAAQIGVPAIKIHWGQWEAWHRGVTERGGADIFQPLMSPVEMTTLIEMAITRALKVIDEGSKDISSLTKRQHLS